MDINFQILKKLITEIKEYLSSILDATKGNLRVEVQNFPETNQNVEIKSLQIAELTNMAQFPEVQKVEVVNKEERKEVERVEVVNQKEFPKQIRVEVVNQRDFPEFPEIKFPAIEFPKEIALTAGDSSRRQYVVLVDKNGEPVDFEAMLQNHLSGVREAIASIKFPVSGMTYGGGVVSDWHEDVKTFDGSDNTFVLTREPKLNSLHLFLGEGGGTTKQTQGENRDYALSGRTITFNLSASQLNGLTAVANYTTTS